MNNGDTPATAVIIKPAPGAIPGAIPGARGVGWTLSDAVYTGLTKREHFAGLALQGILANSRIDEDHRLCAKMATLTADELLKELDKEID